ncbi:glycosyltransferase [Pedobacter sp. HMWF019]|uniref:glycosyltransferase family 4 protein n=1 Tax=Pedobacter sp. HMWF019 TaxID=2056856 RepID=UPI000D37A244|nr:glycosyltransferase family 4 protein [Pedobacter sp. HMWF019]PTT03150.1 glycosyltransferase [Pedobacter sp. HMWF019]
MEQQKILIIGLVWPEPASSAAGTRIVQLIKLFHNKGYDISFASAASKSEFSYDLKALQVKEYPIKLNDSGFNELIKILRPDIVIYDRFMVEEQYGWRVHQECPGTLKILDTEDLHFLRQARQQAIKTGYTNLYSDLAKREIAAILRCDLSLIISEMEMILLKEQFRIDPSLLYYLPFLEEEVTEVKVKNWKNFEEREGFTFIGNFLHEPNWHTVQVLKTKIWPLLRKKIQGAGLHIYGAYPSQKVTQLHNAKEHFYVHGRAKDAREAIEKHRILLAPIQFGAGVKGKFIDAMQTGTPSVTTSVGAEAMKGSLDWNGAIEDQEENFIQKAVQLYQNKELWTQARENGISILNQRYANERYGMELIKTLQDLSAKLDLHRQHNFIGQILQQQSLNSTKYMSLWIEEKMRLNPGEEHKN